MPIEKENLNKRVENIEKARIGAKAEKLLRDLARDETIGFTDTQKSAINEAAEKAGEDAMVGFREKLGRKIRRTEKEPDEKDWELILEVAKDIKDVQVKRLFEMLHSNGNKPITLNRFWRLRDYNSIFRTRNLPYRFGSTERDGDDVKLFIVEKNKN